MASTMKKLLPRQVPILLIYFLVILNLDSMTNSWPTKPSITRKRNDFWLHWSVCRIDFTWRKVGSREKFRYKTCLQIWFWKNQSEAKAEEPVEMIVLKPTKTVGQWWVRTKQMKLIKLSTIAKPPIWWLWWRVAITPLPTRICSSTILAVSWTFLTEITFTA